MSSIGDKKRANLEREWDKLFAKQFQLNGPKSKQNLQRDYVPTLGIIEQSKQDGSKLRSLEEQLESLDSMKFKLNETKSLLNDYDIKVWQKHTSFTNLCSNLSWTVREKLNAEFCTNAWLKFATIINSFDVLSECITSHQNNFGSVHLCEAPGAFVTCLNHHIKKQLPNINWQWIAATLNPYYEGNEVGSMITDDRFIRETMHNWEFGVDFSGNIMDVDNLRALKERCKMLSTVNLVTADGGIDCSDDPCKQEVLMSPLLYWEIVTALEILSPGGMFIVKIFTALEKFTISLIYVLFWAFEEVHFCKPGPSKPGNSEVYVICKSYHGQDHLGAAFMDSVLKSTVTADFKEPVIPMHSIPVQFFSKIMQCEEFFISRQIEAIKHNIKTFENVSKGMRNYLHRAKKFICDEFVTRFGLEKLHIKDHLSSSGGKLDGGVPARYTKTHSHNFLSGNFYERQMKKSIHWNDRIKKEGESSIPQEISSDWYNAEPRPLTTGEINEWQPIIGKKYDRLRSTQFCINYVMMAVVEARKDMQNANRLQRKLSRSIDEYSQEYNTESIPAKIRVEEDEDRSDCNAPSYGVTRRFENCDDSNTKVELKSSVMEIDEVDHKYITEFQSHQKKATIEELKYNINCTYVDEPGFCELESFLGGTKYGKIAILDKETRLDSLRLGLYENASLCSAKESFAKSCFKHEDNEKGHDEVTLPLPDSCGDEIDNLSFGSNSIAHTQPTQADDGNSVHIFDCGKGMSLSCLDEITELMQQKLHQSVDILVTSAANHEKNLDKETVPNLLLLSLILTLRILKSGGTLVCEIGDIFSNFNGGVVYMLSRVFDKFTIFKPLCMQNTPTRYLICCGFSESDALCDYLRQTCKIELKPSQAILHLLPIKNILETDFSKFLQDMNLQHAKLEIN